MKHTHTLGFHRAQVHAAMMHELWLNRAHHLATLAHSLNITPNAMAHAEPWEWAQLVEASRKGDDEDYGVPSMAMQREVVKCMREMEVQ